MKRFAFAAGLMLAAAVASAAGPAADASIWRDRNGQPIPDSASRKSKDGFGGSLVLVTDTDWKQKWETPSDTVPSFHLAKDVGKEQHVFALIFFANPQRSPEGRVDLQCDVDFHLRPDGSASLHQVALPCWRGPLQGNLALTYLSQAVIDFKGDPPDPTGDWTVRVTLRDATRGTALPLEARFHLH